MYKSLVSSLIIFSLAASPVFAGALQNGKHNASHEPRGNFTRTTEQVVTDKGFNRTTQTTKSTGETATKLVSVERDKASGVRTKNVTGTNFKGESFSSNKIVQRNEQGYTEQKTVTGPKGEVTTRNVNAVVNKQEGTITKDISLTKPNGEVSNRQIVKKIQRKKHD